MWGGGNVLLTSLKEKALSPVSASSMLRVYRFSEIWISHPGAYFDFVVRNCSSLYASLEEVGMTRLTREDTLGSRKLSTQSPPQLSPHPRAASPGSLISQIDNDGQTLFRRDQQGLMAIAAGNLEPTEDHFIRIRAPLVNEGYRGMRLKGLWLNEGGWLLNLSEKADAAGQGLVSDSEATISNLAIQQSRRISGTPKTRHGGHIGRNGSGSQGSSPIPQKILEIMSDLPRILQNMTSDQDGNGFSAWEDLVGDMFGADHISINADGICLSSSCTSGLEEPVIARDLFFRRYHSPHWRFTATADYFPGSGPPGGAWFSKFWDFRSYIPDALV
jgi:hypothetical protein